MNFKEEDFALDLEEMKNFQSLSDMLKTFPKAKISKDFYCPNCKKHEDYVEDETIAQSKLIPFHESEEDFYWYETIHCEKCNKDYVIKNQNF